MDQHAHTDTNTDPDPWLSVPSEVGPALRAEVARASRRVTDAIRAEIPIYDQPLGGEIGQAVGEGVHAAIERFIEMIERREADALGPRRQLYYDLGRREFQQGRTLDHLLGAYRVGARVALQEIVAACERSGVAPQTVYQLADSLLAYINELSWASTEGFGAESAAAADVTQAARQELVQLLADHRPYDPASVAAAVARARYRLPSRIAALACRAREPAELVARLGPSAVAARVAGLTCVLISAPEQHDSERLTASVGDLDAALGPSVTPDQTARSFELARRTLTLMQTGAISQRGLVWAEQHLATLALHDDQALADTLQARWLTPLETQTARYKQGLPETLLAWLSHRGDVERTAHDLHVHPNTIRYRLDKLRDLYGSALDDPEAGFELQLALRAAGIRRTRPPA